jgi:hypothetical protein
MNRQPTPRLREAGPEDYPGIARLATRYEMPPEPWKTWASLWLRNPAYKPGMPIGWVLERAKEIVGWFANVPLHYVLNGELVRTMTPRSWVVDEDVRTFAVLLADTFLRQQKQTW